MTAEEKAVYIAAGMLAAVARDRLKAQGCTVEPLDYMEEAVQIVGCAIDLMVESARDDAHARAQQRRAHQN